MIKTLKLDLEVSGCPTTCAHCGANGGHYPPMPLKDLAWVLEEAKRFCQTTGLKLSAFPFHEVLAHPQAAEVLRLYRAGDAVEDKFEPIATDGVALAMREDWGGVLEAARALGTTTFWFAFHGMPEVHDRFVSHPGAYQKVGIAVERVRSMGFKCGCNVFLTRESIPQFDSLVGAILDMGIEEVLFDVANYVPTPRGRRHEASRPELQDLLPLTDKILATTKFRKQWHSLATCTEAAYRLRILEGEPTDTPLWILNWWGKESLPLVCRSNLDLHSGVARFYGQRLGNLRSDGLATLLGEALASGSQPIEAAYWGQTAVPSLQSLAERFAVPDGQRIHMLPRSMHLRWLDLSLGPTPTRKNGA